MGVRCGYIPPTCIEKETAGKEHFALNILNLFATCYLIRQKKIGKRLTHIHRKEPLDFRNFPLVDKDKVFSLRNF